MEKVFGTKIKEFFSSISDVERNNLKQRMGKMAAMCPCMNMGAMPDEDKGKMIEKMKSCCGDMMEKMSSVGK
jgi:hypothetical protein